MLLWVRGFCCSAPLIAGTLCALMAGGIANAADPNIQNDAFSALRNYVQVIDSGRQPATSAGSISKKQTGQESTDGSYAALIAFSERIGADRAQPIATGTKVAEAESLFDAIKEWSQQKGPGPKSSPAAPAPGAPVAGGTKPSVPVDATVVGSKVCATCHASSVDQFSHTLMGRLAKTQKGKFECENCHGPGS